MKIPDIEPKTLLPKLSIAKINIEDYWLLCLVYLGKNQLIIDYLAIKGSYNHQFFTNLQEKGFLEEIHGNPTLDKLKITDKFVEIFINEKVDSEFEEFISTYRNLWPDGIKSMGQFPVKGTKSICIKKMKNFIKEHPKYDKDTILKATQLYLNESSKNFYNGITTAAYFIEREGRGSILESYCEIVSQAGDISEKTNLESI